MAFTYYGAYGPESIAPQYGGQPGAVAVYTDLACTILATLYSTRTGTALANPLPVSTDPTVTGHFPGVDVLGNMLFYAAPGPYYLRCSGATFLLQVRPDPLDLAPIGIEGVNVVAAAGAAQTLFEPANATINDITLTANCTITLPTATPGSSCMLILRQGGTGSYGVTFSPTPKYPNAAVPVLSTAVGAEDALTLWCLGGSTPGWRCALVGTAFA